jgi:hypothetical protein
MSFIVVHELAVSPSRRAVVALYKMSSQSIMSLLRCLVVHELHELIAVSPCTCQYKMSSQSIMSLLIVVYELAVQLWLCTRWSLLHHCL